MGAATPDAARLAVSTPVTSQGWRPISVTYQPDRVAIQPAKVIATRARAT
jgi:hypothetical protein